MAKNAIARLGLRPFVKRSIEGNFNSDGLEGFRGDPLPRPPDDPRFRTRSKGFTLKKIYLHENPPTPFGQQVE